MYPYLPTEPYPELVAAQGCVDGPQNRRSGTNTHPRTPSSHTHLFFGPLVLGNRNGGARLPPHVRVRPALCTAAVVRHPSNKPKESQTAGKPDAGCGTPRRRLRHSHQRRTKKSNARKLQPYKAAVRRKSHRREGKQKRRGNRAL